MASIEIPRRFNLKLENDPLEGIIKTTASTYGQILEENKLDFFKEYTNHGLKHINDVLISSDNLITNKTFENVLSSKDIGFYILSVILHDLGMHINLEGLNYILDGNFDDVKIIELDKFTWKELWTDYLKEAKKFSGKQLQAIFGDSNFIVKEPQLNNPDSITTSDNKLIGEFIRRNHPRLAHEIALKGFPTKSNTIPFALEIPIEERNIIGLISRSHGMNVRTCQDYIEDNYGKEIRRIPLGIHAAYLMILLRISDYIQIDSKRINKDLLKYKTFSSPISELEHSAHFSIDNIDYKYNDDPEKIFVMASPKDSKMYLKLKKLIQDIQYEFDISWAVLGELYGKANEEEKLEIKYRRISSNLVGDKFISKQEYVTDKFSFKANEEIIKLLVAPLYGNDPKYGVRELLQNAVDACNERTIYEKQKNKDYDGTIEIDIVKEEDGIVYFKISDNGIGMDLDVIKNYFLCAGASYRKSINWQKEFLNENGKSKVRRSGRFGVGILAAFLIGNEITVESKKVGEEIGYKFHADLNTEQINILKYKAMLEGTCIKIKIDDKTVKKFNIEKQYNDELFWYDWFVLNCPKVKYSFLGKQIELKQLNPDNIGILPITWNAIDSEGYEKIHWTYENYHMARKLTCNGIVIPDYYKNRDDLEVISVYPRISVFDDNAVLPLTLDRQSLSEKTSYNNELISDIYKDFIAYFLVFDKTSQIKKNKIIIENSYLKHPGFNQNVDPCYGIGRYEINGFYDRLKRLVNTFLVSKKGFILNYNFFIQKLQTVEAVFIQYNNNLSNEIILDIKNKFLIINDNFINSIEDYKAAIEPANFLGDDFQPINSRIFMNSEKYKYIFKSAKKRAPDWLKDKLDFKYEESGISCLQLDAPKSSLFDRAFLKKHKNYIHFIREYEITCPFKGDPIFDKLLEKYIGEDVIIPYSIEERRKKYPLAFKELERYMEKYITQSNTKSPY